MTKTLYGILMEKEVIFKGFFNLKLKKIFLVFDSDKYILTKNGGIVLLNITEVFGGIWTCLEHNNKLAEYSITVDGGIYYKI